MTSKSEDGAREIRRVLDGDEVREVLRDTFYAQDDETVARPKAKPTPSKVRPTRPEHYEVICISLYRDDLERLDEKVTALKAQGHRKMSRSALIRYALDTADLTRLPRGY